MANMIELIKELRERTGAGMMDCKHALEESNQDVEKAISSMIYYDFYFYIPVFSIYSIMRFL